MAFRVDASPERIRDGVNHDVSVYAYPNWEELVVYVLDKGLDGGAADRIRFHFSHYLRVGTSARPAFLTSIRVCKPIFR